MNALREQRELLSITQAQLAFLLGTSQPNVSAIELGDLEVGDVTHERIAAFLSLRVDSLHSASWLGTCASHARTLKSALRDVERQPRDVRDECVLRYIIGMNDAVTTALESAPHQSDFEFFLIPPGSTGDHDVDVLLAGMSIHWARAANLDRVPTWSRGLAVEGLWWLGLPQEVPGDSMLRTQAFVNAVPSLRARGIVLDARSLESV